MKWRIQGRKLPGYYPRIVAILLAVLLILVTFYYQRIALPKALAAQEEEVLSRYDQDKIKKRGVLILREGFYIDKGTTIDDLTLEGMEILEVPLIFLPSKVICGEEEIRGCLATVDLSPGQILTPALFKEKAEREDGSYRLVPIRLEHDLLGALQSFDLIDVLAFLPTGNFEVLASKVPVYQIRRDAGEVLEVLVPLDDFEHHLLIRAGLTHTFGARLYLDESQPPSSLVDPYLSSDVALDMGGDLDLDMEAEIDIEADVQETEVADDN